MSAGELSLVPESEPAPREAFAVRLGLTITIEGRHLPWELAFCSSEPDSNGFFVKVGARTALCRHCDSRHKILNLIEALERGEITLGGDDGAWPIVTSEEVVGLMFREIQEAERGAR